MKFNALSHSTLKITTRNDISKTCAESFHNINIFTRVVCGISDQIRITFQVLQDLMKSKKEVRQCLFQGECNKTKCMVDLTTYRLRSWLLLSSLCLFWLKREKSKRVCKKDSKFTLILRVVGNKKMLWCTL